MTDARDHELYREAWIAGLRGDPAASGHRVPARRDAWMRGWRDGRAVAAAGREFHQALAAGSRAIALGLEAGERWEASRFESTDPETLANVP